MVASLTMTERRLAVVILIALSLVGLTMGVVGRSDLLGVQGFIVLAFSVGMAFVVMSDFYSPEPDPKRLERYYDDPTKAGIVLAMIWAVDSHVRRRLGRSAACLAGPHLRRGLGEFRAAAAGSHQRRHLRLRRQRADRHLLPRSAAHVARAGCPTSSAPGSC